MDTDDWEALLRAYKVFNVDPLDGTTEFGRLSRALRKAKPDLPHNPINPEFEKKIRREKPGVPTAGRFARKPRAALAELRRKRATTHVPQRNYAESYKNSLGTLGISHIQLTPPKVLARQELHNKGIPNEPEGYDRPLLPEHLLQKADEAEAALIKAGMPPGQAKEYAMRGLVITRDGRHFAWVPFDPMRMQQVSRLSERHTKAVAVLDRAQKDYDEYIQPLREAHAALLAKNGGQWKNLLEAQRLVAEGNRAHVFDDGTTSGRINETFEEVWKNVLNRKAESRPSLLEYARKLPQAKYDEFQAQAALDRTMAKIERKNSGAMLPPARNGTISLTDKRAAHVKNILDTMEFVDDHLPQKLRDMPAEVRKKHLIVEALSRSEVDMLEEDDPIQPRYNDAAAFAQRGGNRITVILDNIDKKVAKTNAAEGQDKIDALAWNMPVMFKEDGTLDARQVLRYILTHEMGHTYDVPIFRGYPNEEYNMSVNRDEMLPMMEAGGIGKYGMSTAGKNGNWQNWEAVAEAFAQMILHDQFQPDDLKQPTVLEFMRLFGLL